MVQARLLVFSPLSVKSNYIRNIILFLGPNCVSVGGGGVRVKHYNALSTENSLFNIRFVKITICLKIKFSEIVETVRFCLSFL